MTSSGFIIPLYFFYYKISSFSYMYWLYARDEINEELYNINLFSTPLEFLWIETNRSTILAKDDSS